MNEVVSTTIRETNNLSTHPKSLPEISLFTWRAYYIHEYLSLLQKRRHIVVYLLVKNGFRILYLLRSLLLLRIRCENHPHPHTPCDLCMFRIMIIFALCFTMSKATRKGEGRAKFSYHLIIILGPLFLEWPHLARSLPYYTLMHRLLEGSKIFRLVGFTQFFYCLGMWVANPNTNHPPPNS
jgi:hypothetical protein